jgi:IS30 family transposase
MGRIGRPGLSDAQKLDLWRRWKTGESLSEIARVLGKYPGSIYGVLAVRGGVVPRARTRSCRALTFSERETISRGLATGCSIRAIARELCRPPSTNSREVTRNTGRSSYRAVEADERAWGRAVRPKRCHLATYPALCAVVAGKLEADWSPVQIAGWLAREFPDDETMHVGLTRFRGRLTCPRFRVSVAHANQEERSTA